MKAIRLFTSLLLITTVLPLAALPASESVATSFDLGSRPNIHRLENAVTLGGVQGGAFAPTFNALDPKSLKRTASLEMIDVRFLVWEEDGQGVLVASSRRVMFLPISGHEAQEILTVGDNEEIVSISREGMIAVAQGSLSLSIRAPAGGVVVHEFSLVADLESAMFSPDGEILAVKTTGNRAIQLWEVDSGKRLRDVNDSEAGEEPFSVAFGPTRRNLIWVSEGLSRLIDTETGRQSAAVELPASYTALALSPRTQELAVAGSGVLSFIDSVTGKPLDTLRVSARVHDLTFSLDGQLLAVATANELSFLAMPLAEKVGSLVIDARDVEFSPPGEEAIVTAEANGMITIWQAE
jgi:WD40 repeat protein